MDKLNYLYHKKANIVSRVIGDEVVITSVGEKKENREDTKKDYLYVLENDTAKSIWKLLDKYKDFPSIKNRIAKEFNIDQNILEKDLNNFLEELVKSGIVEKCPSKQ